MTSLPSNTDVAQVPGTERRYPGFGLACYVCGYGVDEFVHFARGTVMLHHGRKCILWKEVAHADNV